MSSAALPLDLEGFLNLETEFGYPVRDLELRNGMYLVWKVPMSEQSKGRQGKPIFLAAQYRRRAVGNLVAIIGYVIRVSAPWLGSRSKKHWVNLPEHVAERDGLPGTMRPRYKTKTCGEFQPQLKPGRAILYNSYNVGQIFVPALNENLVVVREIDVMAHFAAESIASYELGEFALSREHVF